MHIDFVYFYPQNEPKAPYFFVWFFIIYVIIFLGVYKTIFMLNNVNEIWKKNRTQKKSKFAIG